MRGLRKLLGRSAAMINVYQSLWNFRGERPGELSISFAELGADVGAMDQRTARGHIERLEEVGLVHIIDRDKKAGVVHLYVYDHRELGMPRRVDADPQAELFERSDEVETTGDAVDTVSMNASEPRQNAREARGGFYAETPAQKPPRPVRPAANESNSLHDQRFAIRTSPPPLDRHVVSDHGTIENPKLNLNHAPIEQPDSHGPWGRGGFCSDAPAEDFVELHRRRALEQDRVEADRPTHIAQPLMAAILRFGDSVDRATTPAEQKHRLENFILGRVADRGMDRSIAGRAADYVLSDGLPLEVLQKLLDELDQAARAGKLRGPRGAWFFGALNKRIAQRGIAQRGKQNLRSHPLGHGRPEIPRAP